MARYNLFCAESVVQSPSKQTKKQITDFVYFCRSVRIQFHADAVLVRQQSDGAVGAVSRITAFFHTPSVVVNAGQPIDFPQIITSLNNTLEQFNTRGSGFILDHIERFVVSVIQNKPRPPRIKLF